MTEVEFTEWLAYHCSAFPGLSGWLDAAGDGTVDAWRRCLSMCKPADAYAATDAILRDGPPDGYSRHPSEVFKRCQAARSRDIDDQDWRRTSVRCRLCQDSGYVAVWHPDAVTAYEEGCLLFDDERTRIVHGGSVRARHLRWAAARCPCERGQGMSQRVPTYHPRKYVRAVSGYSVIRKQDIERFVEIVSKHANRWRDPVLDGYAASADDFGDF